MWELKMALSANTLKNTLKKGKQIWIVINNQNHNIRIDFEAQKL